LKVLNQRLLENIGRGKELSCVLGEIQSEINNVLFREDADYQESLQIYRQLCSVKREIDTHRESVDVVRTKLSENDLHTEQYARAVVTRGRLDQAKANTFKLTSTLNMYRATQANVVKLFNQIAVHIIIVDDNLAKDLRLTSESTRWEFYNKCTAKTGFPHYLVQQTIPQITKMVNDLLRPTTEFEISIVWGQREVTVGLVKDLTGTSEGGSDVESDVGSKTVYDIDMCSGYERFMVNLGFRNAWSLLGNRPKMNALFIDEGWGAFDQEHLSQIGTIFEYLQQYFQFIIVITHVEELRDHLSHLIKIQRPTPGCSYVMYP